MAIATLPANVIELYASREQCIMRRVMAGGYFVVALETQYLDEAFQLFAPLFTCVWSHTAEIADKVRGSIAGREIPILHIGPADAGTGCTPDELNRGRLRKYVADVRDALRKSAVVPYLEEVLSGLIEAAPDDSLEELDLATAAHLLTVPNELALQGVRCKLRSDPPARLISVGNELYFEALRLSVDAVKRQRKIVLDEMTPLARVQVPIELILASASTYKEWTRGSRPFPKEMPERLQGGLRELMHVMASRETYAMIGADAGRLADALQSEEGRSILFARTQEVRAFTACLAIRASANLVPVVRLPPSVNSVRTELTHLTSAAAGNAPNRQHKLSKVARNLSKKMSKGLPSWLIEELHTSRKIKLVSDSPLEWLPVEQMPLVLRSDCSRITTTPGNVCFQLVTATTDLLMPPSMFKDVLIIRAFRPDDPIRDQLKLAVTTMQEHGDGAFRLHFIDVNNRDELITALNGFSGAILVFDGHGKHDRVTDTGILVLPDEDVSAWALRSQARIPPIVVLSACDTHPFDGSHATTANGFLTAGAQTVIGTSIPVNATYSAIFVARLLFRVREFLPILLSRPNRSARWAEIFSGLQRRQYCTEVIFVLNSVGFRINGAAAQRIMTEAGLLIDGGEPAWMTPFIGMLATASERSEADVRAAILRYAYITDALAYVQLGNPERLVIAERDTAPVGLSYPDTDELR
jgi:hypothetical protein